MKFEYLRDLDKLFSHRWEALVILCLADQPARFSELARATVEKAGVRLPDGNITRSLDRLRRKGLVGVRMDDRHRAYELTGSGQRRASELRFLLEAMEDREHDDRVGTTPR
ncbi:hypothetical protein ACN268_04645 [Micromonospora sp. WMMD735]|uniref:hypothetical protein n=1 Tax=Micromonospora sp. WMMD735 TaxID=3404130 RepID=UPI003B943528